MKLLKSTIISTLTILLFVVNANAQNTATTGTPKIEIYTHRNEQKSQEALLFLNTKQVIFTENSGDNMTEFAKMLELVKKENKGFMDGVTFPVFIINGKLSFSIPNLNDFLAQTLKYAADNNLVKKCILPGANANVTRHKVDLYITTSGMEWDVCKKADAFFNTNGIPYNLFNIDLSPDYPKAKRAAVEKSGKLKNLKDRIGNPVFIIDDKDVYFNLPNVDQFIATTLPELLKAAPPANTNLVVNNTPTINIGPEVGQMAPDITLNDANGKPVSLSSLKGKNVVLFFWASWDQISRDVMYLYVELYERYKSANFEFYAVSTDTDENLWKEAIKSDRMNWTNVISKNNAISDLYKVKEPNYLIFIDKTGKITFRDNRLYWLDNEIKKQVGQPVNPKPYITITNNTKHKTINFKHNIEIYTPTDCYNCQTTIDELNKEGIPFKAYATGTNRLKDENIKTILLRKGVGLRDGKLPAFAICDSTIFSEFDFPQLVKRAINYKYQQYKIDVYTNLNIPSGKEYIEYLKTNNISHNLIDLSDKTNSSKMWSMVNKAGVYVGNFSDNLLFVFDGEIRNGTSPISQSLWMFNRVPVKETNPDLIFDPNPVAKPVSNVDSIQVSENKKPIIEPIKDTYKFSGPGTTDDALTVVTSLPKNDVLEIYTSQGSEQCKEAKWIFKYYRLEYTEYNCDKPENQARLKGLLKQAGWNMGYSYPLVIYKGEIKTAFDYNIFAENIWRNTPRKSAYAKMPKIEIYTNDACVWSSNTLAFFDEHKIPYTKVNGKENWSKMMGLVDKSSRRSNPFSYPLITVDDSIYANYAGAEMKDLMADILNRMPMNYYETYDYTKATFTMFNDLKYISFTDVKEGNLTILRSQAMPAFNLLNKIRLNPASYSAELGVDLSNVKPRPGVNWSACLMAAAEKKAKDMAKRDYFAHVDPDGYGMNYHINNAGYRLPQFYVSDKSFNFFESLARGFNDGESAIKGLIIDANVTSLGHRKHLLGMTDFYAACFDFGIGIVKTPNGTYYCVLIAKQD